jgi:hypothetical protein
MPVSTVITYLHVRTYYVMICTVIIYKSTFAIDSRNRLLDSPPFRQNNLVKSIWQIISHPWRGVTKLRLCPIGPIKGKAEQIWLNTMKRLGTKLILQFSRGKEKVLLFIFSVAAYKKKHFPVWYLGFWYVVFNSCLFNLQVSNHRFWSILLWYH